MIAFCGRVYPCTHEETCSDGLAIGCWLFACNIWRGRWIIGGFQTERGELKSGSTFKKCKGVDVEKENKKALKWALIGSVIGTFIWPVIGTGLGGCLGALAALNLPDPPDDE